MNHTKDIKTPTENKFFENLDIIDIACIEDGSFAISSIFNN
jgi:hypothetical protein